MQKLTGQLTLDTKACYTALQARDNRFDGRFFVGVSSTGIYCRPICRVRLPREKNCSFFVSAAAAEAAGYRPCLKCRPELAPGLASVDSAARLARNAALLIESDGLPDCRIAGLAALLGITDRHLRRVFAREYGVSPVEYLRTWRLLLAKRLLTDTRLPITEIAMLAGFGSIRRFNDLFKKHYRLTPGKLKSTGKPGTEAKNSITLSLGYRPPYAWEQMIAFLAVRTIPGVELVNAGVYYRTIALTKGQTTHYGWIAVANNPEQNALVVTLANSLLPVLPQLLAKVRFVFDLNCSPLEIYEKLSSTLSSEIILAGIRLPGCFDPFEMAVRAVLGQQVTVKAARTLAMRFAAAFGEPLTTPFAELSVVFPGPEKIAAWPDPPEQQLGPLGIIKSRAGAIAALAQALTNQALTLSPTADPEQTADKLLKLPGFGPWTVQYIKMRALGWPDEFLATDYGVKKALPGLLPQERLALSRQWSPWRSYATITLWHSLTKFLHTGRSC